VLVIALALAASALAKDALPPVWEEGRVIAQSQDSSPGGFYAAPIGRGVMGVPLTRRTNTVDMDDRQKKHYFTIVSQRVK
jgi:hypothetical protein